MKVELIAYTPYSTAICCEAAAVCTNTDNGYRALKHSIESGHESVLEHISFTFSITGLSRAALAQLTRHRLASYSVQSQRYVRIEDAEMIVPESIRSSDFNDEAVELMNKAMDLYKRMCDSKIPKEDARYITPQAVPTRLLMTMNARELLHFFSLRCCNRAQWEIRHLADEMLRLCNRVSSVIFQNAGPGCVRGKCPEKRPCGNPKKKIAHDE